MARTGGHQGLRVEASGLRLAAGNPDGDRWPSWGERDLKLDTGLVGRWRVSAESMGPGAEGSLLAEVGGLVRGLELVWGRGRGQERSQGAKAKNWGKGHGKAANTFIYLRIYFLI